MDLLDIILFENEHTGLDFKAEKYEQRNHLALLKDVLALANADTESKKYLIVGVKLHNDKPREVKGIDEIIDDASIQQVIIEYIEPEITIKYYSLEYNSKIVGILELVNPNNPPYMMKKLYNTGDKGKFLHEGESWIRIGTHQKRLMRRHIDNIISNRLNDRNFQGKLEISLINEDVGLNSMKMEKISDLPSKVEALKIEELIRKEEERIEKNKSNQPNDYFKQVLTGGINLNVPEDLRSLKLRLSKVSETYLMDDLYYIYEFKSNKINISLNNGGLKYVEDATVEIIIDKQEGLDIPTKVFSKPYRSKYVPSISSDINWENSYYPVVAETETEYKISVDVGDLKHGLNSVVFKVPLRIVITDKFQQNELFIRSKVFGKNILTPIELSLKVDIKG